MEAGDKRMGGQQEARRPAGRVTHRIGRFGLRHVDDDLDHGAGREILPRALGRFLRRPRQQTLVDVALDIRLHRQPIFGLDQVHDQALQGGRVLDIGTRLLEDFTQHARLLAQLFQNMPVMHLQLVPIQRQEAAPTQFRRHQRRLAVRRLGALMGHLQEQQEADLLRVTHVGQAIVAQHMREIPGLVDDILREIIHS